MRCAQCGHRHPLKVHNLPACDHEDDTFSPDKTQRPGHSCEKRRLIGRALVFKTSSTVCAIVIQRLVDCNIYFETRRTNVGDKQGARQRRQGMRQMVRWIIRFHRWPGWRPRVRVSQHDARVCSPRPHLVLLYANSFGQLTNLSEMHGGSPWGASTFASPDGSRQPSELELEIAMIQGKAFY